MRRKHGLALIVALVILTLTASLAAATAYHTIVIDGDMDDWAADELMETDNARITYITWDDTNLYIGLVLPSGEYLGDNTGTDKSFFVAIDTDLVDTSGAGSDGYGRVNFTGSPRPEIFYAFAGATGWYEWASWNGSSWDWQGWSDWGTYYDWSGNPAPNPGTELTIPLANLGDPDAIAVFMWVTPEGGADVDSSWPTPNPIGTSPDFVHAYHFPSLVDGIEPDDSILTDHVIINELDNYTEWIELYNPTDTAVDISNWQLTADYDSLNYTIPGGTTIAAGGYWTYATSGDMNNGGDVISLYDDSAALVDQVGYGNYGGAPAPSTVWRTMARVPNGTDTDDDARDWNLTTDPTQGAANNVPAVLLGSTLVLNEFDVYPPDGGPDQLELYNPTTEVVTVTDWYISDGDAVDQLTGAFTVPAGGWLLLTEGDPGSFTTDFSSADVGYLFLPNGIRVDQIGWDGEYEDETFQRICDGHGPSDGYDWDSSGGGVTWFDLPETLGSTNTPGPVDMSVEKMGPVTVAAGDLMTYVISYEALEPMPTTSIVITDELPGQVDYVDYSASPTVTLLSTDPPAWDAGARCGFPEGVITLTVQVTDTALPGDELVNMVEVTATGDLTPTNNTDTFTTTVAGSDISVVKACLSDPFLPDKTVTYTIGYDLIGDPPLGVVITDVLPAAVTYITDTSGIAPSQPTTGTVVWDLGDITDPGSFVITAVVSSEPMTWTFTNQVWITASNDDLPNNNYDSCTNLGPMPIQEIQYVPDPASNDASPYEGQHVWVMGVVVAGSDVYTTLGTRYFVGDPAGGPWSGLYVYHGGDRDPVQEGDWVLLYGEVAEYYGLTELNLTDSADGEQHIISSTNPLPMPELVATGDFTTTSPNTAEPYESVLIEFQCATVISDDLGFGEWLFDDGTGAARADAWSDLLSYEPTIGDEYASLQGLGNYSYDDYKVVPRYDDDITLAPQIVAVTPAPDTQACTDAVLTVEFDMDMDATAVENAFGLEGPSGPVSVSFSYDPATWTATFTPTEPLVPDSSYTATVDATAANPAGVPLCAPYEWSFTAIDCAPRTYIYLPIVIREN